VTPKVNRRAECGSYRRINGGTGAMKIFATFMVFILLVAVLYGIFDIWSTLKTILAELREINGKIG
jgi:hypothetical protein